MGWFNDWTPQIKFGLIVVLASFLGLFLSFCFGGFVATAVITLPALYAVLKAFEPTFKPSEGGSRSKMEMDIFSFSYGFCA
jgi:hypothetical protein